jgi:hypothetical protein
MTIFITIGEWVVDRDWGLQEHRWNWDRWPGLGMVFRVLGLGLVLRVLVRV